MATATAWWSVAGDKRFGLIHWVAVTPRCQGLGLGKAVTQRAMQLLETPYKIIDIAGMVGFDNAKYFSQVFKKQVGKTPQQYRTELRKAGGI